MAIWSYGSGYGENSRVMKWAIEQVEGKSSSRSTAIGLVPIADGLDIAGLNLTTEKRDAALRKDQGEWRHELPLIREWFGMIGEKLPSELTEQLATLEKNLQ